jgi:hypothetical protein
VWWIWGDTLFVIAQIEQRGKNILASDNLDEQVARFAMQETFADGQYLGTLDDLRARAKAGDMLYTDNSAVVERLTAENAKFVRILSRLVRAFWANQSNIRAEISLNLDAAIFDAEALLKASAEKGGGE